MSAKRPGSLDEFIEFGFSARLVHAVVKGNVEIDSAAKIARFVIFVEEAEELTDAQWLERLQEASELEQELLGLGWSIARR